ncbi:META domain-containing protein [Cryobacterium adonitolivorans]|uniref:META domain-containing protein n=2 Tax=Cryobacterium adonitolivorans TaxID=1259189 RepID=A0A4R8WE32_9MICO|nr:META domain-containing protein [Cryobacterium adonitolivorans]
MRRAARMAMRLRLPMVVMLCGLALTLSGCAGAPGAPPVGPGTTADSTSIGLVNLWRVSGVAEEEADTWLRLDVPHFEVLRDCGMIMGEWRATDTLFLASVNGASGACGANGTIPEVAWLESVTGYQPTDAGWELVDAVGTVVASLTVDGEPDPIPSAVDSFTEPPPITDAVRAALRRPVAVPDGSTPATTDELTGRWVPPSFDGYTEPHLLFEADGSWTGSDGCNGNQGRWTTDGAGALLATAGLSTAMGCEGVLVPSWVAQARLAVIDDNQLRLLDADGVELGLLERG